MVFLYHAPDLESFGNHRFEWPFQLAPVAVPILGADFLKHYNLLLDVSNQRVFSADSLTSPSIVLPTSPVPSLLHSQPTFSPLLSVSPTSSQSFQMWSRPTVSRLLNLVTELLTIYSRNLVLRCSRRLDVWTWRSWRPPSESFPPWRKPGSFATLTLLGLRLFIWSGRRTEAGALVEITDD